MEHVYKPLSAARFFCMLGGFICLGGPLYLFSQEGLKNPGSLVLLGGVMLVVAVILLKTATEKITLSDDAIESRDLLGARRLVFGDIAGWVVRREGGGRSAARYSLRIMPGDNAQNKYLRISSNVRVDAVFKTWLLKFPNLTTSRLQEQIKALKEKAKLGDADAAAKVAKFEKLSHLPMGLFQSPEEMAERYFRQWGL